MNKAPSFQFYAQDFLTGVVYLTNEEIGIYIKMLCKQWTDGKIPKKRLGLLVGLDWENFSSELKSKFEVDGDFLRNTRLELERNKKKNFLKKQAENGKKGGRPPKKQSKSTVLNNPNESQKKPLEDEDEIEEEKEIEKRKRKTEKKAIVFPFETEEFKAQWKLWKLFKQKEFGFKYKSEMSEQGALKKLSEISNGNQSTAIKIIHQSISEGWKGLFKIKNDANGNHSNHNGNSASVKGTFNAIDAMYGDQ